MISYYSAKITWTAPEGETPVGYALQRKSSYMAEWSEELIVEGNEHYASGDANAKIDIRVKAVYANGETSNYVRYRYMNEAYPQVLPINDDFENGLDKWRVVNGKIYTEVTPIADAHSGVYVFRFDKEKEDDQYLISPPLMGIEDVYLRFFYRSGSHGNTYYLANFYVGYSTTTNDLDAFIWSELIRSYGDWQVYTDSYPSNTKYIAIRWSKSNSNVLYLDDISIWTTMSSHLIAAPDNWHEPTRPMDGWYFIASPVEGSIEPIAANNLIFSVNNVPNVYSSSYDLYRLNNTIWENFKAHKNDFVLENGKGYLYASELGTIIRFTGRPYISDTKTVGLGQGYNLVGNPFYADAYIDRPYYRMNDAGTDIEAVTDYINTPVPKCTGVLVTADGNNETVTFTKTPPAAMAHDNGNIQITLMLAGTRDDAVQDKAIVSFTEGTKLEKFMFCESHSKLYIPQGGKDYAVVSVGRDGVHTVSTTDAPVNFKAAQNGEYTLSFDLDGVESDYLHLIDNLTGADIDLLALRFLSLSKDTQGTALRQAQRPMRRLLILMPRVISSSWRTHPMQRTHPVRPYRWWI